jgi:hypothetical protein
VNLCSASKLDDEATGGWGIEVGVDVGLYLGPEDDPETELNGGRSSSHSSEQVYYARGTNASGYACKVEDTGTMK